MINKHTELCLAVKRPTRFKVTLFTRCSRSSLRNEEYIRCAFREDGEGKKPHFKKAQKKRERAVLICGIFNYSGIISATICKKYVSDKQFIFCVFCR